MKIHDSCYNRTWLIVGYLTSSGKYFMHFQDENTFNNIQCIKTQTEMGVEWENRGYNFRLPLEKFGEWVGSANLAFYSGHKRLLFFEIYRRVLLRAKSVALSQHVAHYGPWPGFPYYNLTYLKVHVQIFNLFA